MAALWVALLSAFALVGLRVVRVFGGPALWPAWTLKSAVPLMAIGFSYLALICTLPRSPAQRVLGFLVGLAFILWGTEQYLHDQAIISLLDDIVVCLFVLDLGLVVHKNLRPNDARRLK